LLDEVVPSNWIGTVVADAEFDSERNHRHIREQIGAQSIIPAKRGKPGWKLICWGKTFSSRQSWAEGR